MRHATSGYAAALHVDKAGSCISCAALPSQENLSADQQSSLPLELQHHRASAECLQVMRDLAREQEMWSSLLMRSHTISSSVRAMTCHYTYRLTLADALCGPTMHVPTLDGRQLDVVMEGVAHPNAIKVVRGEGMPISKSPGTRGDLRIHFDIIFPKSLSPQQKNAIRANLPAR